MTSKEERVEKLNSQRELSQLIIHGEDPVPERLEAINKIWNEQEEMLNASGSRYTMQEVILDLDVLRTTGSAFGKSIKSVKANTDAFTLPEFAAKFNTKFAIHERFNWEAVADVAAPIINRAPGLSLMLGTFKPNAPFVLTAKRKRASRTKDELSQKQKPENVEMVEKNSDGIDVKVNFVVKALKMVYKQKDNVPVPLYDFILHPTNFTTTVENIFYLSFVIRDGLAQIDVVDGEMVISPLERTEGSSKQEKKQMIFSITKEKWETVVRERNIRTPAINWNKKG